MKSDDSDYANANEACPWEFKSFLFVPWLDAQTHFRINLHTLDGLWGIMVQISEKKKSHFPLISHFSQAL